MFSSKKDAAPAVAAPGPVNGAKRASRTSAPSIISADLIVQGTLKSSGDIQVDGRVEGDVHSASLVIGDKAFIQGEILAEDGRAGDDGVVTVGLVPGLRLGRLDGECS